jgi:hypothetical protein
MFAYRSLELSVARYRTGGSNPINAVDDLMLLCVQERMNRVAVTGTCNAHAHDAQPVLSSDDAGLHFRLLSSSGWICSLALSTWILFSS